MNSKERAELKGKAMKIDPIFNIGKTGITPEFTTAIDDALRKRELIKISVLKNCDEDLRTLAETLSQRTHSQVVQVIGRKIVLFRLNPELHKEKKEPSKNLKKKNLDSRKNADSKSRRNSESKKSFDSSKSSNGRKNSDGRKNK